MATAACGFGDVHLLPLPDGERLAALLDAVTAIAGELDADAVPARLTTAARLATGARRAAVARRDGHGAWCVSAAEGLDAADLDRLTAPPHDGTLVATVRCGGRGPAVLVVTDKPDGFGPADVRTLDTLAAAASRAIENAAMFERTWEQAQLLEGTAEIVRTLATGASRQVVLDVVARWARRITDAEVAGVAVPSDDDLVVAAGDGPWTERLVGLRVPGAGTVGAQVLRERRPAAVDDVAAPATRLGIDLPFGAGLIVPMGEGRYFQGIVAVTNTTDQAPVPAAKLAPLAAFADRAGLALELAGWRRNADRLVQLEERERIAAGLRDVVVHRLLAVASTLSAATALVSQREAGSRLRHAIDQVDLALADIRSTIFG